MMNIHDFKKMKESQQRISMITCYDYSMARIIANTQIDCILVGDSVAMVMHGHTTTLNATMDMMAMHTEAVVRGAPNKFIIADLPFLSYRKGLIHTMDSVERVMQAGAHAVKLEGVQGNEALIEHIVQSGVPVMGHLGLTPQSIHHLGGFKVQGREDKMAKSLLEQAKQSEALGCFALVLECIPQMLATQMTESISIPTIGIGAGPNVSGQVLVLHDLLGLNMDFNPKFMKKYMNGAEQLQKAIDCYVTEVKTSEFPLVEHCY